MSDTKRIHFVDMAKGVALLFVMFGHAFRPGMCDTIAWCDYSYSFVYSFHVSLLFLLSGMSYGLTKAKHLSGGTAKFIGKKAKGLLLPWFSYSVLIYVLFVGANLVPQVRGMLAGSSYAVISPLKYGWAMLTNNNPYTFHVWYLQTLFLFVVCTYLIDKYLGKYATPVKIVLIALSPAFYQLFCESWVWVFKAFFQKYFFFLLGSLMTTDFVEKSKKVLAPVGLLCGVPLALFLGETVQLLYATRITGMITFYIYNAVIVGFCLGITALCACFGDKLAALTAFGRNSLPYYLYHQPFCCAFLGLVLYEKLHIAALPTVVICFVCAIVIPWCIIHIARALHLERVCAKIGLPM